MQCLPFSRLVNTSDTSLGCTTCETGNVLFKIFTQDMFACRFECLEGYVSVGVRETKKVIAREERRVCVFITAGPSTKMFTWDP
jgi:hypothetical protein